MRPDVVLVDISGWKEPLEGLVSSIRTAAGDPMIIALNTHAESESILLSMRAGINEYLYPPLQEPLRRALEKRSAERSRRNSGGTKGSGKAVGFLSAKGGCGATTLVCHVAAELGRLNHRVLLTDLDLDTGMVGFITKTKAVYSILDAVNNLHRLDISYWKALVSNGIPGVEIVASPLSLASKQQVRGTEGVANAMQIISNITRQTSQGARQTTRTVENMVKLSEQLNEALSQFRISTGGPVDVRELAAAATAALARR
jgi:pilus assembly protein CpaE